MKLSPSTSQRSPVMVLPAPVSMRLTTPATSATSEVAPAAFAAEVSFTSRSFPSGVTIQLPPL